MVTNTIRNTSCIVTLTSVAIIVSTSGDSITQQMKTAQSRNNEYIMRVLVDCFTTGKQLQHKLQVSEQQQHATCAHMLDIHYCYFTYMKAIKYVCYCKAISKVTSR